MKVPRFIKTDKGLILETAIPLTSLMRETARQYAIKEYKRRLTGLTGERRQALVGVINSLVQNDFTERAIPAHDCDKETVIYGRQ